MKKSNISLEHDFIYTYEEGGRKLKGGLFYNPLDYGLRFEKKLNCCLYFRKGNKRIRIKTATGIVLVEQIKDEEDNKVRLIAKRLTPPQSKESFEKLLRECKLI